MSWFENQINERKEKDDKILSDSFYELSSVIMPGAKSKTFENNDSLKTKNAVEEICKFYRAPINTAVEDIPDINEQLEVLLRPSGIMRRRIKLLGKWWQDAAGALLGETTEGDVVALIPKSSGYYFFSYKLGKSVKVMAKTAKLLKEDAVCFYKPLPNKSLGIKDLFAFMSQNLSRGDIAFIGVISLAVSLLGMFTPYINQLLFAEIIPTRKEILAVSVGLLLIGVTVSTFLLNVTKSLVQTKISSKLDIAMQSAVMGRVINLQPQFFKNYSVGELQGRINSLNQLCGLLVSFIFGAAISGVFSIIYILQIASIVPELALIAFIAILLQIVVAVAGILVNISVIQKNMYAGTKTNGIIYSLFSGIQKIKLSGAEKRAFSKWSKLYKVQTDVIYNPPLFLKIQPALSAAAILFGTLLIYIVAANSDISLNQYMAFISAFGLVGGAMLSLIGATGILSYVKPILDMGKPILEAVPEVSEDKKVIKNLKGNIELSNVSFRYTDDTPLIINNLSLKIKKGQYVAIVGKTGCGKSTLFRILLGFEKPLKGAVYYDNEDMAKIDTKSLRKNIGVVLQNGKLFQGDVYSNITISAPWLTLDEAWNAAEMAGVAEDIRNMPMGMHTLISEGAGGISGGQRQRIMIARAIAPKPKILMFDEATSALDNITQKQVSESLSSLDCTRIVIAHRLSTIRHCDRIIVLDKGQIVEDGDYDSLVALNGVFAELVKRQQIDGK